MGIPSFYRHLIETYPHLSDAISSLINQDNKIYLYLDFNGMIHPCVGKVIDKYENKENINRKEMILEMYEEIKNKTLELVNKFNPYVLYVAIDGVAPRAKMEQQRTRRYKTIIEKSKRRKIFDTNSISPGTPWMMNLIVELKKFFNQVLSKKCKIVFSGADRPGEGEHKLIKFIRKMKNRENTSHIIYGLDADLIMLSLSTHMENIYLLRDKQDFEIKKENKNDEMLNEEKKEKFNILPIGKLRNYYWNEVIQKNGHIEEITQNQYINDFIFLCFFCGNDFLPHLKIINIHNNGIEMLLEEYIKQVKIYKTPLLDENYNLNQDMLLSIFKKFSDNENEYVNNVNRKSQDTIVRYYDEGWKHRYYQYYFYGNYNQDSINKVCENYFQILKWTTKYYFEGTENWSLYYQYIFPPCFSDLYKYLQNNNMNDIVLPKDEPYTPTQQLMIILPPQSKFLIPERYNKLMFGRLRNMYVHKRIELDKVDKHARFMWMPVLPKMNDELIKRLVQ